MKNMDIKKYLKKYKWVLVFALAVAMAAGIFVWLGDKYSASLNLTVSRLGTQNAADYKYDSYYALKASDEFGSAVEGWFKTPSMTQAVYQKANLSLGPMGLNSLSRRFLAVKISPVTVEVRFSANSEADIKAISQAVASVAQAKADLLNSSSNQGVAFTIIGSEPVIVSNAANLWRNILAGFFIGLVFGFFMQVAKEYFRKN